MIKDKGKTGIVTFCNTNNQKKTHCCQVFWHFTIIVVFFKPNKW